MCALLSYLQASEGMLPGPLKTAMVLLNKFPPFHFQPCHRSEEVGGELGGRESRGLRGSWNLLALPELWGH